MIEIEGEPFDDYDPGIETDGPFGPAVGSIPMGTLSEVMGSERAKPLLDELEEYQKRNAKEVQRILGSRALRTR